MSLWKVADDATRDLMVAYYTRLLKGEGRADTLRQAQREIMARPGWSHPFFWASFIPLGEWGPLDVGGRSESRRGLPPARSLGVAPTQRSRANNFRHARETSVMSSALR